ncbi:MAG: AAA family ATPase, partial [Gammaproteobacteria bacterium]|nr:AAA family ATPase [Gammaproteobacteria bacterium]
AQWTVILGDNGTGKTTLLKCLAGLELADAFSGSAEEPDQKKRTRLPKLYFFNETCRNAGQPHDKPVVVKVDSVYYARLENVFNSARVINARNQHGPLVMKKDKLAWLVNIANINSFLGEESSKNFKIYAYGASRRMGSGTLQETQNTDAAITLFSENEPLINAGEWLLQADYAVKSTEGEVKRYAQSRFEKIKALLIDLLPDVSDIRPKGITKTRLQAAVEVETPYGWVPMADLSLGCQTLIAWMTDLAVRLFERYPDKEEPLKEPAIVLVDEIDLHMHPKWQRNIIAHLTRIFKNTQFIVTVHSPLIVQAASDANLVLLKREGSHVNIHNQDCERIKGWRYDQVLTSDLFGLDSARPPEYDALFQRREILLAKPELSEKDKMELEAIGRRLDELPVTNTPEDNEAMSVLRKAADILKQHHSTL